MTEFKLMPADILDNVNLRNDPYSLTKRWLVGPYDHVSMYMGRLGIAPSKYGGINLEAVPLLFESNGRGVVLQSLSNRYGQEVVVMRLKEDSVEIRRAILNEAIKLASSEKSYYDYYVIATYIIPWLILQKLHIPIPVRYHRNALMICSEACAEVFWRSGIEIVPKDIIPLPSSFVETDLVAKVWEGILGNELVI